MSDPRARAVGRHAVMATRAPDEVEADSPELALFRKLNFFPTAPWASRAAAELVLQIDPAAQLVADPACGQGHMSLPLAEYFPRVLASDIHDYGLAGAGVRDFLDEAEPYPEVDWIITNPPFKTAKHFQRLGMERARRGVVLLLRVQFNETPGRYPMLRQAAIKAPFTERVDMVLGRWDPKAKTATAYTLYVWMHPEAERESRFGPAIAAAREVGCGLELMIAPGTKARLWREDDPRRFGHVPPGGLFDLGTTEGQSGAGGAPPP